MLKNTLKGIAQILVVGLPSWFILVWTASAALVPGTDVFIIALIQVLFIVIFIGWYRWRVAKREPVAAEADATTAD